MTTAARLFDVQIRHVRRQQIDRTFTHRSYQWLVDLDALPQLPWALRGFARFRAADHLGDPGKSLRRNVTDLLAEHGIDLEGGTVLMLANARAGGYVFNPLTVFWCHHADGSPAAVVAEVHNTYQGRHAYVLATDDAGRARTAKDFYVSPFLTVDGQYRMSLPEPADRLALAVALEQEGRTVFTATVTGTGRPATTRTLLRLLVRDPFPALRATVLIRWHGIRLWARGLPIVPRTRRATGNVRPTAGAR